MSEFYVGQKVVCVDAVPHNKFTPWRPSPAYGMDGLTEGAVYTIRGIQDEYGVITVALKEITRPVRHCKFPCVGWSINRFAPLQSKAISIFRAIAANPDAPLPGQPTKEKADLDLSQAISQPFSLR